MDQVIVTHDNLAMGHMTIGQAKDSHLFFQVSLLSLDLACLLDGIHHGVTVLRMRNRVGGYLTNEALSPNH